jgi:hypothetical protein
MMDKLKNARDFAATIVANWAAEMATLNRPPGYLPTFLITLMVMILIVDIGLAGETFNELYADEYSEKSAMDWVLTIAKSLLPIAPAVVMKIGAAQFGIFAADKIYYSNRDRVWIKRAKIAYGIALGILSLFALFFLFHFGQLAFMELSLNGQERFEGNADLDLFASTPLNETAGAQTANQWSQSAFWLGLSMPLSGVALALLTFRLELYYVEKKLSDHYQDLVNDGDALEAVNMEIAQLDEAIFEDEEFETRLVQASADGERAIVTSFTDGLKLPAEHLFRNEHLIAEGPPTNFNTQLIDGRGFAFTDPARTRAQLLECIETVNSIRFSDNRLPPPTIDQ